METNVRKEIELFQSKQNELASIKNQLNKKRTDFEKKLKTRENTLKNRWIL